MSVTLTRAAHGEQPRQRTFPFRAAQQAADDSTRIAGYASVFGSRNRHGEVFVPGAYSESLARVSDVKPLVMTYLHRDPIGRWADNREDQHGLHLDGPISRTPTGEAAATLARDGVLTGLSIGFWPRQEVAAEPGEDCTFTTPFGPVSYRFDKWTWYVLKADLVEAGLVMIPSDDDARVTEVRSLEQAARAMPALTGTDSPWEDVAYSMALLMGGRGATTFSDLDSSERHALYERLAAGYRRHDRTPPPFAAAPTFSDVRFAHDERDVFADRYLRKTLDTVTAGATGISGALSAPTRQRARDARDALTALLDREPGANDEQLRALSAQLLDITRSLTKD